MIEVVRELPPGVAEMFSNACRFRPQLWRKGHLIWERDWRSNLLTTVGMNEMLDKFWKGSSYSAAHYLGIITASGFTSVALGDTMSSHAGWVESTAYVASTRPAIAWGTVAAAAVSATAIDYVLNGGFTPQGAFITTVNTKGGTTGTLINAAEFSSPEVGESGDTLRVMVSSGLSN